MGASNRDFAARSRATTRTGPCTCSTCRQRFIARWERKERETAERELRIREVEALEERNRIERAKLPEGTDDRHRKTN